MSFSIVQQSNDRHLFQKEGIEQFEDEAIFITISTNNHLVFEIDLNPESERIKIVSLLIRQSFLEFYWLE